MKTKHIFIIIATYCFILSSILGRMLKNFPDPNNLPDFSSFFFKLFSTFQGWKIFSGFSLTISHPGNKNACSPPLLTINSPPLGSFLQSSAKTSVFIIDSLHYACHTSSLLYMIEQLRIWVTYRHEWAVILFALIADGSDIHFKARIGFDT